MKKYKLIMTIFLLIIFIYSVVNILMWFIDNKKTSIVTKEIYSDEIIIKNEEENSINFDKLKNKNKDTIAWLKVNGTNIDYPVVQTKDNDYYLNHSYNKKNNNAGWIFMDYRNNLGSPSKNTIIYGHARIDKSMFGTLKYTLDKKWYKNKDNQIITLTTSDNEYKFQTFSTYHIKTEDYYITTDFNTSKEFKEFIKTLKKRSVYDYKIDINEDDYILTLSSCYKDNQKVVLHAKLIKEF